VDSDDRLPPRALESLVESARRTGSDIVVGALQRFNGNGTWRPQWLGPVHSRRREGIRIDAFPALTRNLYTCDKLFRHDFWTQQGLAFREGVAYEDQPLVTQLYARARSIDVLPDVVYDYRSRDDRSSISQQIATVRDLRQRVLAWQVSRETLRREVPAELYEGWLQTLFSAHFHWYLNSEGTADDTYWSELQQAVVSLSSNAPQSVWDATLPDKRVLLELTRQDRRADVVEFVRREGGRLDKWRSVPQADGLRLELPFFDDPRLDRSLFVLRPEQIGLAHSIESFRWLDGPGDRSGTASICGWAFLAKVDLAHETSEVSIVLRGSATGRERVFPMSENKTPVSPPPVEDTWCDYEPGAFRGTIPVGDVIAEDGSERAWDVLLRVSAAGFTRTEPVTQLLRRGSAGVVPPVLLAGRHGGHHVRLEWRQWEPLRIRAVPVSVCAVDVALAGRMLTGALA
jgi:CDP-glycerol glycerophosphotransferase